MKTKPVKRCREDVIFDTVIFIILTLILFVVAYPLYWVIISSFSDPTAVSAGKVLLRPIGFTLKGYAEVINYPGASTQVLCSVPTSPLTELAISTCYHK